MVSRRVFKTDRHDDFIKLEFIIREVHELFLEMAALVSQQEHLVTNIWTNMGAAGEDVKQGKEKLTLAERYQASSRKMKIVLAIVLALLIVIIIIILVTQI